MDLTHEMADSLGLHPESIQLDEPLAVAYRFAAQELREAARALHHEHIEVALGGAAFVCDFLIGRAGVLDGGERL